METISRRSGTDRQRRRAGRFLLRAGLGGIGDTKSLLESEFRQHDIEWITNARVNRVESGLMHVTGLRGDGAEKTDHALPFTFSMMLPAFRGVATIGDIEGLVNPRGFVLIDRHQRNNRYPSILDVSVSVAIRPIEATPVPAARR